MFRTSRAPSRLAAFALVLTASLALAGCGSNSSAARAVDASKPAASASKAPTATPSESPLTHRKPTAGYQVVRVAKYGVSFELPRGWITLDAKNVLKSKNPVVDELTHRLGVTKKQFLDRFASRIQTFSVSNLGAVDGAVDTVNTVGANEEINVDQLKLQLATVGVRMGKVSYAVSDAGDVTRIPYRVSAAGRTLHAVAIAVVKDGTTVLITVGSHDDATAGRRADQIQSSLASIASTPGV